MKLLHISDKRLSGRRIALALAAIAVIIVIVAFLVVKNAKDLTVYDIWDYSVKVPSSWTEVPEAETESGSFLVFALDGRTIAGIDRFETDPALPLPTPNHSQERSRETIGGLVTEAVLINLDISEPAASGDPAVVNQNHLYLIFGDQQIIYDIYADTAYVNKKELLQIGRDFYKAEWEGSFRPEISAPGDPNKISDQHAEKLLALYLDNYVGLQLSKSRDINDYRINSVEIVSKAGSDILYPKTFLFKSNYELQPTDAARFGMAGGGFRLNERGWIQYDEAYGIIRITNDMKLQLAGFLHPSSISEYGLEGAAAVYCDEVLFSEDLSAAFSYKTPYIGNSGKTRGIVSNLAFSDYFKSMELQTESQPYGLTVKYDVTGIAAELERYLPANGQLRDTRLENLFAADSLALFALIDNLDQVRFILIDPEGQNGDIIFEYERRSWEDRLGTDVRSYSVSAERLAEMIAAAIPRNPQ